MDRVEAILERGDRARALMGNATVAEAMDHITEQLVRQWRSTTAKMTDTRESLFHQIAAMDAVRAQLRSWVEQADFERAQIEKQEQRRKIRLVR